MSKNTTDQLICPSGSVPSVWWIYIVVSILFYVFSLGICVILYFTFRLRRVRRGGISEDTAEWWLSGPTFQAVFKPFAKALRLELRKKRALFITVLNVTFVANAGYWILYIVRTYSGVGAPVEGTVTSLLIAECFLVIALIPEFLLRVIRARNIIRVWFTIPAIVDALTFLTPFLSLIFGCDWLGLRFLRFLLIIDVPPILILFQIITKSENAGLVNVLFRFVSVWLTASGLIHLLEISGDPWTNFSNHQDKSYLEFVYFSMTTMTTVGYGDITPVTAFGRAFVTLFMVSGLTLFAASFGPIREFLSQDRKYYGEFSVSFGKRHVVLSCESSPRHVNVLLMDLLYSDRLTIFDIPQFVILNSKPPSSQLQATVKKYYPHAFVYTGSLLKVKDLKRVKLKQSCGCIVITDTSVQNYQREDKMAVMKYLAVKNHSKNLRVIVQVLLSETADLLRSLPCWSNVDMVVCVEEWRLGWLASACYCPGLSTVIGNLLYPVPKVNPNASMTFKKYAEGAALELYPAVLPSILCDRNPEEVVTVCFSILNAIMIAVKVNGRIVLNPLSLPSKPLSEGTAAVGYFLAKNKKALKTALNSLTRQAIWNVLQNASEQQTSAVWFSDTSSSEEAALPVRDTFPKSPSSESHILTIKDTRVPSDLKDHIVLCLFTFPDSAVLNLVPFFEPIVRNTSSSLVVLAEESYLKKLNIDPLNALGSVYLVSGTPIHRASLELARVPFCRHCALLTVSSCIDVSEPALIDMDAILCLRMIEGMLQVDGCGVPFTVELLEQTNVQFIHLGVSDSSEGQNETGNLQLSQAFAQGNVTTVKMINLLLSTSLYDPEVELVVEQLLRSQRISQMPMSNFAFQRITTFGEVFSALLLKGKLCVAIKRVSGEDCSSLPLASPNKTETLLVSDILMVMQ